MTVQTTGTAPGGPASDEDVLSEFGYKQELNRTLSAFDLFGLSFSTTSMTTGVFLMVGPTLAIAGTLGMWLVLLVGFPTLAIVFSYAALSRRIPIAGQEYQWGRQLFGRVAGVASGWPGFIWALVAVVAVSYVLAATVLPALLSYSSSPAETTWIAVAVVVILASVLIVSVKLSGRVTRYGAISEIAVIGGLTILLVVVGAIRGHLTGGGLLFTHKGISSDGYFTVFGWKSVGADGRVLQLGHHRLAECRRGGRGGTRPGSERSARDVRDGDSRHRPADAVPRRAGTHDPAESPGRDLAVTHRGQ
jgi:amino acid permease